jgi:hypothetical protein
LSAILILPAILFFPQFFLNNLNYQNISSTLNLRGIGKML